MPDQTAQLAALTAAIQNLTTELQQLKAQRIAPITAPVIHHRDHKFLEPRLAPKFLGAHKADTNTRYRVRVEYHKRNGFHHEYWEEWTLCYLDYSVKIGTEEIGFFVILEGSKAGETVREGMGFAIKAQYQ